MITFNIILEQTQTGTILERSLFLLIAGLIGFFISYFYYRKIYWRKIEKLKGDLKDLEIKMEDLKDQE